MRGFILTAKPLGPPAPRKGHPMKRAGRRVSTHLGKGPRNRHTGKDARGCAGGTRNARGDARVDARGDAGGDARVGTQEAPRQAKVGPGRGPF